MLPIVHKLLRKKYKINKDKIQVMAIYIIKTPLVLCVPHNRHEMTYVNQQGRG